MFETFKFILFSAIFVTPSVTSSTTKYLSIAENSYKFDSLKTTTLGTTSTQSQFNVLPEKKISEKILEYSEKHGIDAMLALNIACAESCTHDKNGNIIFNPNAKNPNSTASGIFQFLQGTWNSMCEGDVFDENDNIECAVKILATSTGIKHWEASRMHGFGNGWSNKPYENFKILN